MGFDSEDPDAPLAALLKRLGGRAPWAVVAALGAVVAALIALAGWAFDMPRLRSVVPGAEQMKANTALAVLLASSALVIAVRAKSRAWIRAAQASAAAVALVGAATLCEYALGWNPGIDELLFVDAAPAFNSFRGRMSPYAAAAFVALGAAQLVLATGRWRPVKWVCGAFVFGVGTVSALGYLWNAQELITDRLAPPVALNTAVTLLLLGFGTLHAGRRAWELRTGVPPISWLSVEAKMVAMLVGALALLFLGAGYTYRTTVTFETSMTAFARLHEARDALARMRVLMDYAQLAHEGYLISGRDNRRDLYEARAAAIGESMATLSRTLANSPDDAPMLERVRIDIGNWRARMDTLAAQRHAMPPGIRYDLVPPQFRDAALARAFDAIDAIDRSLAGRELRERDKASHLREFTLASLLLTLGVATALCVMLFRTVQRAARARIEGNRIDVATRRVFALLATTLSRSRALDGMLEVLGELRNDGGCAFYALDGSGSLVREATRGACERMPLRLAPNQGLIGEAAVLRHSVHSPVRDDAADVRERQSPDLLACPVVYRDRTVGVIAMASRRAFDERERAFVARIADALGVALNNLRQYSDLERVSAELSSRMQELQRQAAELEHANRLKSEFLATMSHELRTPLNAIIGFAEVLKDGLIGELTQQQREYVGDIVDSGAHLLALINDILDLSKVEAGTMDVDIEPVDLCPLFDSSLAMVKEKALAHKIALTAHIDDALPMLQLDARKLKQIAYNLLSNAVKFTPDGGAVTLRVQRAMRDGQPRLEVAVEDTGIGIAHADQARLFQPFVQVDGSLGKHFQGSGLGLAMVKRLAELLGGSVELTSTPGKGSTFVVLLPWHPANETRAAVEMDALGGTPASMRKALVIEADDRAAEGVGAELAAAGLDVVRAVDPAAALAVLAQERPDVITLSASMPPPAMTQFMAALRDDARAARVPVVILVDADNRAPAAAVAAAGFGTPVERKDLHAALAALGIVHETSRHVTALVVDDEPRVAEVFDAYLQAAGCRVIRVTNGADALAEACAEQPDVIVLDLLMPDMSGFEVVDLMKALPETRGIPIVVMTAKMLTAEDRNALEGQVEKVLTKTDFRRDEFVREVIRAASIVEKT
jgi:signal transduction histidine kinase/CheY-like chemotaxis protein